MKREDIKKAAFNTIDAPCERNCEKCDCKYKEDCIWSHLKDGFVLGAEWRINSVWHDANEMPEKKFALVEYDCFPKGHGYLVVPDAREVIESITRWAYMDDLIPDTED